jgi:hypothetical protein
LVYNSALNVASSCCSYLLHDIANLIIFLVSRQLALLTSLPQFFCFFCGQKGSMQLFFWKIISWLMSIIFILFS